VPGEVGLRILVLGEGETGQKGYLSSVSESSLRGRKPKAARAVCQDSRKLSKFKLSDKITIA